MNADEYEPITPVTPEVLEWLDSSKESADTEKAYRDHVAREQARERYALEKASERFTPFSLGKNLKNYAEEGIPEPVWLIDTLLEQGANLIIQGDSKAGKSTVLMETIRCLAEREPLFESYATRLQQGRIAYLDLEMGLIKTLQRFTKVTMSAAAQERILPLSLTGKGFDLMSPMAYELLVAECIQNNVKVVVFDPLMHLANLDSENDNAEVTRVIRRINTFKEDAQLETVILVAHTPDGTNTAVGSPIKVRGATAWMGWAGHFWNCYYRDSDATYHFKLGRSREMPEHDDAVLKARQVNRHDDGHLSLGHAASSPKTKTLDEDAVREYAELLVQAHEATAPIQKSKLVTEVRTKFGLNQNKASALIEAMHNDQLFIHEVNVRNKVVYTRDYYYMSIHQA